MSLQHCSSPSAVEVSHFSSAGTGSDVADADDQDTQSARSTLACARPTCKFLVHRSLEFGGYCCNACFGGDGAHSRRCQARAAPPDAQRADEAWEPLGSELTRAERRALWRITEFLRLHERKDCPCSTGAIRSYSRRIQQRERPLLAEDRRLRTRPKPRGRSLSTGCLVAAFISDGAPEGQGIQEDPLFRASNVVDGDPCSRWSSRDLGGGSQGLRLDLRSPRSVIRIDVRWELAYARTYALWGSLDAVTWTELSHEVGSEGWVSTTLPEAIGLRFLELRCGEAATDFGFSIWEVDVFGPDDEEAEARPAIARQPSEPQLRVGLLMAGSRGDCQPVLALALQLRSRGVRVMLLIYDVYSHNPCSLNVQLARIFQLEMMFLRAQATTWDAVEEFHPQLLLHQWSMSAICWIIEEKLGVRAVEYSFWPIPPWTARDRYEEVAARKPILEAALGVEALAELSEAHVFEEMWRRRPLLYAFSGLVAERKAYWPRPTATSGCHMFGHWVLDEGQQAALMERGSQLFGGSSRAELAAFLACGPPPIYIGWGSMSSTLPAAHLTVLAVRTLRVLGHRGIIMDHYQSVTQTALLRAGEDAMELLRFSAENVLWLKSAPHEWLLPQCRAAVHHGGCSTTASSLRSGKPTVITPITIDQFYWGDQVARLAVGACTDWILDVTAPELAAALASVMTPEVEGAAEELGRRLRAEQGPARAAEWIQAYANSAAAPCSAGAAPDRVVGLGLAAGVRVEGGWWGGGRNTWLRMCTCF